MDADLRKRAQARAAELGISFSEYVKRIVIRDLGEMRRETNVSILFNLVEDGPETDVARNNDEMVAAAIWKKHQR